MAITRASIPLLIASLILFNNVFTQNVTELIEEENYPVEVHKTTTKTGYILSLQRITDKKQTRNSVANNGTKPVVLLQHGLATSSDCWVLSGPKSALAYQLADKGYDVWLANSRGTIYSNKHTKFNTSSTRGMKKYNRYSFHQKGNEDLLTTIDFILQKTGQKNLALYAHSEGAAMFYALGATQPAALKKINSFYGFAPLVFVGKTPTPLVKIASLLNRFKLFPIMYQIGKPLISMGVSMLQLAAGNMFTRSYTTTPISMLTGGFTDVDGSTLSKLYKYFPSNVNVQSLTHLLQLVSSGQFKKYRKFWRLTSKKYKLQLVDIPMYLYFSPYDLFINTSNMYKYNHAFDRKPKMFNITSDNFGHYDFCYSNNAKHVYQLTFDALANHTKL